MKTINSLEHLKITCENVYLFMTDTMGDMEKMMETEKDLEIECDQSTNVYMVYLSWVKEWEHYDPSKEPKEVRDYQTLYVNKGDSVAKFMKDFYLELQRIEGLPEPQVNDLEPNIHML